MELLNSKEPVSVAKESRAKYAQRFENDSERRDAEFKYALDLLKTNDKACLNESMTLFVDLFQQAVDDNFKRDCLYFLAINYAKLCDYQNALNCCDNISKVQPDNHQVQMLRKEIERRLNKDGMIGVAVAGSAVMVGIGAVIGLLVGLTKR